MMKMRTTTIITITIITTKERTNDCDPIPSSKDFPNDSIFLRPLRLETHHSTKGANQQGKTKLKLKTLLSYC